MSGLAANERVVAPLASLPPGGQHVWQEGLTRVLVCRDTGGNVSAMMDLCPHARQPLAGGLVDAVSITCPKHGARFDLRTGAPLNAVCRRGLQVLAVRVVADDIVVALPTATDAAGATGKSLSF